MRRTIGVVLISIVGAGLCVALAGAQPATGEPATGEPATGDPAAARSPEDEARRAKPVAKIGGTAITVGDVEDAVNQQSPFLRARYKEPGRLREFVDNMIRFELLATEAERRGYNTNPEVQQQIKQNSVQQLMRVEFNERITPESIPQEDVQAYYDTHPEEFHREELRRASHLQVKTSAEAQGLLKQAREADARGFRQLARDNSIDRETKLRGGDLRYFNHEGKAGNAPDLQVDAALVGAAFALTEVGDVSAPVQVGEFFSIVKLTGRRPAEHRTLEQADHEIRLRLWREQRQQAIEQFVEGLRTRAAPEIFEERMAPIELDAPDVPPGGPGSGGPPGAHPGAAPGARPGHPPLAPSEMPGEEEAPGAPDEAQMPPAAAGEQPAE